MSKNHNNDEEHFFICHYALSIPWNPYDSKEIPRYIDIEGAIPHILVYLVYMYIWWWQLLWTDIQWYIYGLVHENLSHVALNLEPLNWLLPWLPFQAETIEYMHTHTQILSVYIYTSTFRIKCNACGIDALYNIYTCICVPELIFVYIYWAGANECSVPFQRHGIILSRSCENILTRCWGVCERGMDHGS